jgi:hypothetical protein
MTLCKMSQLRSRYYELWAVFSATLDVPHGVSYTVAATVNEKQSVSVKSMVIRLFCTSPLQYESIQKFPDWVDNEMYAYNNKHSFRSNTKGYGGKTHKTDSQTGDTTAPSGRELDHLQFSLQVASPETFGYIVVLSLYYYN